MGEVPVVASVLAWAIVGLVIFALMLVIRQRPQCSAGEVIVLLIASGLIAVAGGMASLVAIGWRLDASVIAWHVIVLRAMSTALYLGVLLNIVGWRPPLLGRWL